MYPIIINVPKSTAEEADINGWLRTLEGLAIIEIKAGYPGRAGRPPVLSNEQGLLHDPQHFLVFAGSSPPLAGNGVILEDRDKAACLLSLDWAKQNVSSLGRAAEQPLWAQRSDQAGMPGRARAPPEHKCNDPPGQSARMAPVKKKKSAGCCEPAPNWRMQCRSTSIREIRFAQRGINDQPA